MDRQALASVVAQRTGISQAAADQAVEVVIQQLAEHMPGPVGSHLQSFLAGGAGAGGGPSLGDVASKIGGMFGK